MTEKDKLAELHDFLKHDVEVSFLDGDVIDVAMDVITKLIERIKELENIIYQDARQGVLEGLYEENKKLREALEEIKKEEAVTTGLSNGQVAYTMSGHIARKALEKTE